MPALVAGLAVLLLLMLMGKGYVSANPKSLAKGLKTAGGIALAVITFGLIVTGREMFALITAGMSWLLLFGTAPPWQRTTGFGTAQSGRSEPPPQPPRTGRMSRAEALNVLGLKEGASEADIRAAHRRLILQTHPDKGGTNYLAAKINEAKDVLLG
jgi:hypothetical protein